jgi:prepilin-type N-terminal cleavage/methylation domain-containing protein
VATAAVQPVHGERGISLLELLIALVVLSIGVLSLSQLFPAGSRSQVQSRLRTEASQYSREKIEQLQVLSWSDTALNAGRHPTGSATEKLETVGTLARYYQVEILPAPLTNLKQVTVNVVWRHIKPCTVQAVTYLRK